MAGGESHTFFLRRTIVGRFLGGPPKTFLDNIEDHTPKGKTIYEQERTCYRFWDRHLSPLNCQCEQPSKCSKSLKTAAPTRLRCCCFFQWLWTLFWARERTRGSVRTSSLSTTAFSGSCLAVVAYANALQSSHHSHHAIRLQLL